MPENDSAPAFTKASIVNTLAGHFNFTTYLELCTPSTGFHFSEIDPARLPHAHRILYIAPAVFDDGVKIDFRSPDEDISSVIAEYVAAGGQPRICLVDGWHTYAAAFRDLRTLFDLIPHGGVLVVHDCLPPFREAASPVFRKGAWCGVNYKAFLDFVLQTPGLDYFTIDSDYGCGVIFKGLTLGNVLPKGQAAALLPAHPARDLVWQWAETRSDFDAAFDLFEQRKHELLRLISNETFAKMFGPKKEAQPISAKPASKPGKTSAVGLAKNGTAP